MVQAISRSFEMLEARLAAPWFWRLSIVALAALQLALIWSHEAWPDEFQALLIATEAQSQRELLSWLRYEGHPPAWYWLLQALDSVLPRALVLPAAATLCAAFVQGAILFAAPFGRAERLLLALSQYVLFEFLTISRGTTLGAALVIAALLAWRSRWFWLVLACLPLVDFLFGVISGVFLILKWRERDLWWPGVALWLVGSAFAGWSVLPAPDMVSAFDAMQDKQGFALLAESAYGWVLKVGSLPVPFQGGIAPQWNTPVRPIAPVAWIAMGWLCWVLTRGFFWHRLMILGFFGFTLAFSLAVYPIGLRHQMLGCLLLVALVWLQRGTDKANVDQDDRLAWVWPSWLIILAASGLATSALSVTRGFDSGAQVVAEIEARGVAEKRWIALPEWRAPGVTGRSTIAFERLGKGCRFRFVRWDHAYDAIASNAAFSAALRQDIEQNGRGYLLSDMEFTGFDPDLIAPLVSIPRGYDGIDYHLYVVGRKAPEKRRELPLCHSVNTAAAKPDH
ncbi:MAG: hypothetical protein AAFY19_02405 [Pseudomonadota bacterium]